MPVMLTAAQSQLLDHVMAWANLRINEITGDPFASPTPARSRESTQSFMLPSLKMTRYLDRVKGHEVSLLNTLSIDANDMEAQLARPNGPPTFSNYLWMKAPAWLVGGLGEMVQVVMDDLGQIRMARLNTLERVERWKRNFGKGESMDSRPNVLGFQNNLTWLQEAYGSRHRLANELTQRSSHGWNLVQNFYDPAARAAENIMDGVAAVAHYRKLSSVP